MKLMEKDNHSSRNMNSHKRPIVFAVRDFPPGCGTPSNLPEKHLKNPRTSGLVVKNPSIDHVLAAPEPKRPCFKQEPEFRDSNHDHVAAPKHSGTTSSLCQNSEFRNSDRDRVLADPKGKILCLEHDVRTEGSQEEDETLL